MIIMRIVPCILFCCFKNGLNSIFDLKKTKKTQTRMKGITEKQLEDIMDFMSVAYEAENGLIIHAKVLSISKNKKQQITLQMLDHNGDSQTRFEYTLYNETQKNMLIAKKKT